MKNACLLQSWTKHAQERKKDNWQRKSYKGKKLTKEMSWINLKGIKRKTVLRILGAFV